LNKTLILAIALILVGVTVLAYGHFSYRTRETVVELGPIKATAERTKTVPLPPIIGWVLVGAGVGLGVYSIRSKP
jgi:hypothetical protein